MQFFFDVEVNLDGPLPKCGGPYSVVRLITKWMESMLKVTESCRTLNDFGGKC
jgi:hypothetical protein